MVSIKNLKLPRLCFVFIIIFNHAFCYSGVSDKTISVVDFKYYRKISFNDQQLLIYKNSKIKSLNYISKQNEQSYFSQNNKDLNSIKLSTENIFIKLENKNGLIKYSTKTKGIYFMDANESLCSKNMLSENATKLISVVIMDEIKHLNVQSLTDNTCNIDQTKIISKNLKDTLIVEKSWLTDCYNNNTIQKLTATDTNFFTYINSVYSKYLKLVENINKGEKPIQISCKVNTPNKLGSYDDRKKPEIISLDWDNLSKKQSVQKNVTEDFNLTLGHELFHYGENMQTPEDAPGSNCINEAYADLFTKICNLTKNEENLESNQIVSEGNNAKIEKRSLTLKEIKNLKIPTSLEIKNTCKNEKNISLLNPNKLLLTSTTANDLTKKSSLSNKNSVDPVLAEAAAAKQEAIAKAQAAANLQKNISPSDYTTPTDNDYAVLTSDTTPNTQYGKAYTVSADSSFGQTVQKTMVAFTNSGNTLASKINSALATVNTQAVANAGTGNTANTYSANTMANTNSPNTTTNTNSPNTNVNANPNPSINPSPSAVSTNSVSKNNIESDSSKQNSRMPASDFANPNSKIQANANVSASTNANTNPSTNVNPVPSSQGSDQSSNGSNTSGSALTGSSASNSGSPTSPAQNNKVQPTRTIASSSEASAMIKTIQSLKAFNTVTGGQYAEIKKYYSNPQFQNLLQTYDMRIMMKNNSGTYTAIGVENKKAKKVFNDDGKILKTIDDKNKI